MVKNTLLIAMALMFAVFACGDGGESGITSPGQQPNRGPSGPPAFLMQAWIWVVAPPSVVRTYDFTQQQAAGKFTVEIREWQNIGTLGWQSNQIFTALFTATAESISLQSATGYREEWRIVQRYSDAMIVQDTRGNRYAWYNCSASGWPPLIYQSMRGCN